MCPVPATCSEILILGSWRCCFCFVSNLYGTPTMHPTKKTASKTSSATTLHQQEQMIQLIRANSFFFAAFRAIARFYGTVRQCFGFETWNLGFATRLDAKGTIEPTNIIPLMVGLDGDQSHGTIRNISPKKNKPKIQMQESSGSNSPQQFHQPWRNKWDHFEGIAQNIYLLGGFNCSWKKQIGSSPQIKTNKMFKTNTASSIMYQSGNDHISPTIWHFWVDDFPNFPCGGMWFLVPWRVTTCSTLVLILLIQIEAKHAILVRGSNPFDHLPK